MVSEMDCIVVVTTATDLAPDHAHTLWKLHDTNWGARDAWSRAPITMFNVM